MSNALIVLMNALGSQSGLIIMVLTCIYAWWKGGPAERYGSAMVAVTWIGGLIAQRATQEWIPVLALLALEAVLAIGFLILAVRYASKWLGIAMLLEAVLFSLHTAEMSGGVNLAWLTSQVLHRTHFKQITANDFYYLLAVNMISYCVLMMLIGATTASWLKRRADRRSRSLVASTPAA